MLGIDYTKKKTKLNDESITNLLVQSTSVGGVLMSHLQQ
jgi:hypothetical protein